MWRRLAVAGVVCGMATPQAGIAQLLELQPGAKVRVTAPPILGTRYDAVVGSRSGDTLWLVRVGSPTVQVPVSALESVQLSRGRSRTAGAKRGVLWGGGIGVAIGALSIASWRSVRNDYGNCVVYTSSIGSDLGSSCGDVTDAGLMLGGVLGGALWGAGIGALVGRERWESLNVPPRVGLRLDRTGRAARVGVRVAF